MKTLTWPEIWALKQALDDFTGYVSDNSCSDPDCCGGPFYDIDDYNRAKALLAGYWLKWNEETE